MVQLQPVYQVVFPVVTAATPADLKQRLEEINSSVDRLRELARGMGAIIVGQVEWAPSLDKETQPATDLTELEIPEAKDEKVAAGVAQDKNQNPVTQHPFAAGKKTSPTT